MPLPPTTELLNSVLSLFYPELCLACDEPLVGAERHCCTSCRVNLPYLGYHLTGPQAEDNPLARRFWGKVPVRHALAYLQFQPRGRVQQLLHRLKYDRQPEIGEVLGLWFGNELAQYHFQHEFDLIVPVPLHPAKERRRGYNQAACFGEGLSAGLGIPQQASALAKRSDSRSQTRLGRLTRWQNVEGGFMVADPTIFTGKRILLADDVLTTGATLEACATLVLQAGAVSVSTATIAAAGT